MSRLYKDERINMAVKELKDYRKGQKRIENLKRQRELIESEFGDVRTIPYDKVRVSGGIQTDGVVVVALRLAEIDARMKREIINLETMIWGIEFRLDNIDKTTAKIIRRYYIDGASIAEIASEMDYSKSWVIRLKNIGLRDFAQMKNRIVH